MKPKHAILACFTAACLMKVSEDVSQAIVAETNLEAMKVAFNAPEPSQSHTGPVPVMKPTPPLQREQWWMIAEVQ
jgi:hypothetical protein